MFDEEPALREPSRAPKDAGARPSKGEAFLVTQPVDVAKPVFRVVDDSDRVVEVPVHPAPVHERPPADLLPELIAVSRARSQRTLVPRPLRAKTISRRPEPGRVPGEDGDCDRR